MSFSFLSQTEDVDLLTCMYMHVARFPRSEIKHYNVMRMMPHKANFIIARNVKVKTETFFKLTNQNKPDPKSHT